MSDQNLKEKTVKGVRWSAIDNVVQYAVSFCVSIILARLLTPDDYGLIGIIAIFTSISTSFIDGGFSAALIQKKNATDSDFSTVFIINFTVSLLLYLLLFAGAPYFAEFFRREELTALTRVSSLAIIMGALTIVQRTHLTKRIDFKTQTKITFTATLTSGIVGISMALAGCGVWSLVGQILTKEGLRMVLFWSFNHFVPTLRFSVKSFRELYRFGWKMMLSDMINSMWNEFSNLVVGKFYSPATLGQYTRAKDFSRLFSNSLTTVVQRVTFPVLSEIQDDPARLVSAYRRIIKTTMFVSTVCLFFLGAVSEPLIYCLIGSKWLICSQYLTLLCISGSLYPLHAINLNMLSVQGRSDLFLGLEIVKKIIALGPLFVGAFVGVLEMLYLALFTDFICFLLNSYYSGKFLGYSSWMQLKDVAPFYALASVMALSVWFLKFLPVSYWVILPVQVLVGLAVFFALCIYFRPSEYQDAQQLLSPLTNKISRLVNRK